MLRLVLAVLAGTSALAFSSSALAANTVVLRPTSMGSTYAYTTAEATPYVGARADVHYQATGPGAPPPADANGNGYPDYVEQVSAAADKALAYYEAAGFKLPLADRAGPDAKPDIYVTSLPAGVFGLTFTQSHAEGGTFVLVSPKLDLAPAKPTGSVSITVAHELFHVIQFSYIVGDQIPEWAAEGSASAMSMRVYPQVEDVVMTDYLALWLQRPWLPLFDERSGCAHCYGGAWWWLYLERLNPKILPRYLSKLSADEQQGLPTRVGISELDSALEATHTGSLFDVFGHFSLDLYRRGLPLGTAYSVKASTAPRRTAIRSVSGLSTHYIPIHVPPGARGLVVSVPYDRGPRPQVTLAVGGPKGRLVTAQPYRPGKGLLLSAVFRTQRERRQLVLVITSGRENGVLYVVESVAVGRNGRLPGWVAFSRLRG